MIKSINPYNGEVIQEYKELDRDTLYKKISDGEEAFFSWKQWKLEDRAKLFKKVGEYLKLHKERFALLMSREMGKPFSQGVAEIEKCAWLCTYYYEHAGHFLKEEIVETDAVKSYIRYEPLGVVLAVMPWNYPFWQVFRFAVPTLIAGNTGLLKHASNVMGCAGAIEEIFTECGVPEGVFQNLVVGSSQVEKILEHNAVKAVSLTGSEPAGRAVAAIAGREIKRSLLELGGSNGFIVLDDANLEKAAEVAVNARYQNTGQSCIAAKRLLLHENIADKFLEKFIGKVKALKSGDPQEKDTYIGVVAREDLAEELEQQMNRSIESGAELLLGGKRKGAYFEPTVLLAANSDLPVMQEETFGPLMTVYKFKDLDEAIRVSNGTGFGLGVSIFTENREKILSRVDQFEEGAVFINELVKSDPRLPFGGINNSGYGRELGLEGIRAFVNVKTVYVG